MIFIDHTEESRATLLTGGMYATYGDGDPEPMADILHLLAGGDWLPAFRPLNDVSPLLPAGRAHWIPDNAEAALCPRLVQFANSVQLFIRHPVTREEIHAGDYIGRAYHHDGVTLPTELVQQWSPVLLKAFPFDGEPFLVVNVSTGGALEEVHRRAGGLAGLKGWEVVTP